MIDRHITFQLPQNSHIVKRIHIKILQIFVKLAYRDQRPAYSPPESVRVLLKLREDKDQDSLDNAHHGVPTHTLFDCILPSSIIVIVCKEKRALCINVVLYVRISNLGTVFYITALMSLYEFLSQSLDFAGISQADVGSSGHDRK